MKNAQKIFSLVIALTIVFAQFVLPGSKAQAAASVVWRVNLNGQITKNGVVFPYRGGNWFGLEGRHEPSSDPINPSGAPMEQYLGNTSWTSDHSRTIAQTMNEIKALGINVIRLPLSPQTLNANDPQGKAPNLKNFSGVQIVNSRLALETMIKAADAVDIQILLDIHSCSNYLGWRAGRIDARPPYVDATRENYDFKREDTSCATTNNPPGVTRIHAYDEAKWMADLKTLAGLDTALGVDNIIGIDIFNEPWDYTWAEWKTLSEHAYTAINSVNPNILVFVEGVSDSANNQDGIPGKLAVPHGDPFSTPNWGENFFEAGSNLPAIPRDRLVFSPHTYGPSVFVQQMFMDPAQPQCAGLSGDAVGNAKCNIVINPTVLRAGWQEHFGYLKDLGYAVVLGEFGGNMDWPNKASLADQQRYSYLTDKTVDAKWQNALVDYMIEKGIEGTYWAINPESGDTGGLYLHAYDAVSNPGGWGEWKGFDPRKVTMLQRLWAGSPVTPTPSPTGPTSTSTSTSTVTATFTPSPTQPPVTNLALNKPVSCSSEDNTTNLCAKAVDGNAATRWSSQYSDPQWIRVDLGATKTINRVKLSWETAYGKSYQVQTSNDGVNWTTIYATTTGDGAIDDLAVTGSGRYVRIYGTVRGTQWGYSLWELEVYGPTGPTATPTATFTATNTPTITNTPSITNTPTKTFTPTNTVVTPTFTPSSTSLPGALQVQLASTGNDNNQQSSFKFVVKNISTTAKSNISVRVYFTTENSQAGSAYMLEKYWDQSGVATVSGPTLVSGSSYYFTVSYGTASLAAGASWELQTALHLTSWGSTYSGANDWWHTTAAMPAALTNWNNLPAYVGGIRNWGVEPGGVVTNTPVPTFTSTIGPSITPSPTGPATATFTPSPTLPSTGYTGNATHFDSHGIPYGGCGLPEADLDSTNFVALNVQNTPGDYTTYLTRPISSQFASKIGFFNNGLNCGRWVRVTISDFCTGINDGAAGLPFCRNGSWVADQYNGATLDFIVSDSCQDGNAWCRDDANHLDLATSSLTKFLLNGQPVNLTQKWGNRKINWQFITAPNYTGDIKIGFMQGAEKYWTPISINHLQNGIHGVEYYSNGVWVKANMNSDMGQSYLIQPIDVNAPTLQYRIRVYDVNDQLIQNGRTYSFSFPASCGTKCTAPNTIISYTNP